MSEIKIIKIGKKHLPQEHSLCCPVCGESRTTMQAILEKEPFKGVSGELIKTPVWNLKKMCFEYSDKKHFTCGTCGSEWEEN